jgi:RNA polymerase sigma factor (sigma-70 family)
MSARMLLRLPSALAPTDDRALVARFAAERDEAAFAALVKRHGAMVYGVCRRAVRDEHHAEDAFQATFLVLANNPRAAAGAASVAGWLFGVARRVGLSAARRVRRAAQPAPPPTPANPEFDELLAVLDEEVAALPDECRSAVVACFLREQTQDEAAKQLGWSLSTLRRRLDRGKELLRARLTRRGATLSALLLTNSLASAKVPPALLDSAVRVVASDAVPPSVAALAARRPPISGKVVVCVAVVLGALAFASPSPQPTPAPAPRPVEPRPWVTLTGKVVLPDDVAVPVMPEITRENGLRDADYFSSRGRVFDEGVIVEPTTRAVRNAVVWLRPDSDDLKAAFPRDKIHPSLAAAPPRDRVVAINFSQFEPRITVARVGDTVVFQNNTPVANNAKYDAYDADGPGRNFNVLLPPERTHRVDTPLPATRIPDHFSCSIHPWMKGCVWTFDHPYAAVTDHDGKFTIPHAPVGAWRVVVWQERVGYRVPPNADRRLGQKVTIGDDGTGRADLGRTPLTADWDER